MLPSLRSPGALFQVERAFIASKFIASNSELGMGVRFSMSISRAMMIVEGELECLLQILETS
jgi:hypothetical protein